MSKFNLNSAIKSALRRIFARSGFTQLVVTPWLNQFKEVEWQPTKAGGKKKRVFYTCQSCGARVPRSDIAIDHIEPVVGPEGFVNWDTYIERMFCDATNLQLLCGACHEAKSKKEREIRKVIKARLPHRST